jgi:hypothetical protein
MEISSTVKPEIASSKIISIKIGLSLVGLLSVTNDIAGTVPS